ncbi:major histocompatibility complex class I-related gene protein-like isoform X1 [Parambassis ranga]|uniref:Major histocompatibility complex class I-related gene protein-like isoform X1 n=1 Tax=Parambassis ranga TaxID=210632 RepID=A0A6P7HKK0_9TELE|nr:major histocompatibility complex class I-related gene protein-like isoform X1 [Parambassis ranga]
MQGRHPGSEMQVRHKRSLFSSKNQSKMKTFLLFLLLCHVSSAVKHTLRYFLTGSSGVSAFPDFLCVLEVNNIQAAYCDADIFGPKQDWGQTVAEHDPDQVHVYRNECYNKKPFLFKEMISTLKQRFNQTEGVHILQLMSGCELDDTTGQVSGFLQYGYDGEDFIVLDLNTLTWIAPTPKAVITKQRWDTERLRIEYNKRLYTEICPQWLKKFLHYGEKTLLRTDPPSVSLLQKTPSSAVSCHATGFYPDRALMFWSKDGEEIHEGVEHGEMLPNHDGTFQMSVDLTVSSLKTGGGTTVSFSLMVLRTGSSLSWMEQRSEPTAFLPQSFQLVASLELLLDCCCCCSAWLHCSSGRRTKMDSELQALQNLPDFQKKI